MGTKYNIRITVDIMLFNVLKLERVESDIPGILEEVKRSGGYAIFFGLRE